MLIPLRTALLRIIPTGCRYLRSPYDTATRWAIVALGVTLLVLTGYSVGRVDGRRTEQRKAWRECRRQLDSWAMTYRIVPAGLSEPCGGK